MDIGCNIRQIHADNYFDKFNSNTNIYLFRPQYFLNTLAYILAFVKYKTK